MHINPLALTGVVPVDPLLGMGASGAISKLCFGQKLALVPGEAQANSLLSDAVGAISRLAFGQKLPLIPGVTATALDLGNAAGVVARLVFGQKLPLIPGFSPATLIPLTGPIVLTLGLSTFTLELVKGFATVDATPTVVVSLMVPASGAISIWALVQGVQADGGAILAELVYGAATRTGSGPAAMVGGNSSVTQLANTFPLPASSKPTVALSAIGNNLTITCTGRAATTINWSIGLIFLAR